VKGLPLRAGSANGLSGLGGQALFRLSASACIQDATQIPHTMCYSEVHHFFASIAQWRRLITIETSRCGMELLESLLDFAYRMRSGPAFTLHSPLLPQVAEMVRVAAARRQGWLPPNACGSPDCGLKTRGCRKPRALGGDGEATQQLRAETATRPSAFCFYPGAQP